MSKENWTDKIKNKSSAASDFLKPLAASNLKETTTANDNNVNTNVNINEGDYLDKIIEGQNKKFDLVLTGIYLEPELAALLDKLGKQGGRGAKSRIANDALRALFIDKGLL